MDNADAGKSCDQGGRVSAAEYALTADALLDFGRNPPSGDRAFVRWASFADRVGPSLLPFVIRPDRLDAVPFKSLGLTPVRLSDMVPQPDEMWVLFCFRDSFRDAVPTDSPLRADGFPLVLEWRRGQGDSELLSGAFHELADRVRGQFGEGAGEWGLHPAFDRYGDAVAFTDPDLFSDSENSLQIASAWGALAVGLHRRMTGKYQGGWPFPSIQWEWKHQKAAGVAGIAEKLSVAADCGATVVTVAGEQRQEAQDLLAKLKRSDAGGRYGRLSVMAARDVSDPRALARRICDDSVRRVRLRRLMVAAGVFLCALVSAVGAFFYDMSRTVSYHYADYVDSFGLPQGIFPLKESELAHRHVHYRFEYRGFQRGKSPHADSAGWCIWNMLGFRRRLVRVVQANSRGYPRKWDHTEYAERPQIQDFKYDRDLRLREIRYGRYNGEGREPHLVKRLELSNARGVTNGLIEAFVSEERLDKAFARASSTTVPMDGFLAGPKSEITKYVVQRDGDGRIVRYLFYNRADANASDADGIYGFQYEFDGLGRPTEQWYLFREGDGFVRRANKKGVAGRKYEYEGHNMRKVAYVDPEGRPVMGPHGWMVCIDEFDEFDNNTRSTFYDEKGSVTLSADGIAGYTAVYDSGGNQTELSFFGVDGKPTLSKDGVAGWKFECDARGNVTKLSSFDVDGKPTLNRDGYAEARMEYDECGNKTKELYFGVDGKPTLSSLCFAEMRAKYDDRGNRIEEAYFGENGKPVENMEGFAKGIGEYDGGGNIVKESYFGVDGKPTRSSLGFAEKRAKYDDRGNRIEEAYFGEDGKPVENMFGFAKGIREYDRWGNVIKESYFDVDGKPIRHRESGVAGYTAEYDGCGYRTKESYFDEEGKKARSTLGFAERRAKYDDCGNLIEESYFGEEGQPVENVDGFARGVGEYDKRGNIIKESYFGVDGNLIRRFASGVAGYTAEYDGRGNKTKESYFGEDGNPTRSTLGFAERRARYDDRGNLMEESYFGEDGQPVENMDGFAKAIGEYDRWGNLIKESYFDVDGKPTRTTSGVAGYTAEYDGRGKRTKESYFGVDGKPTVNDDGYAGMRFAYKVDGTVAKVEYFDESGKAIVSRQVVVTLGVRSNLAAAELGVREGDVWCRLGTYDIRNAENVYEVQAAMQACWNTEKELIVARKEGDAYKILSFKFPVGLMGIEFDVKTIPDYDKLEQAYRAYCEKEKKSVQGAGESGILSVTCLSSETEQTR